MMVVTAALRDQDRVRVRLGIVGDEESEEGEDRGCDRLVDSGFIGDFAITGEPTDLHIGVEAKGVLALRLEVGGTAAHGATPWLGDNAVLKAIDVFRSIESLPFARQSSELFDRPSINLGRIWGGDALNKVPDRCVIDVDIRYLPGQDPDALARGGRARCPAPRRRRCWCARRRRSTASRPSCAACARRRRPYGDGETMSVGRDGASDAVSLPAGRGAGGRVRPGRRRPSRAGRVGLGLLAGGLPAGARVVPARRSRSDSVSSIPRRPARRLVDPQAAPRGRRHRTAEEEALLVALQPRQPDHRRGQRRRDLLGGPALHRLDRRSARPQPRHLTERSRRRARTDVNGGEPETILILGSDKRAEFGEECGRSDTTILLRLDSEQNLISVMSIPRDLKTEIPGVRHRKVQRRLLRRRAETDPAGGQGTDRAEDQPRDQHRLPRLRPRGRRDRLRLHRRRPPLLPLERRRAAGRTVFGNQHQARLSEALRRKSARVRALPPHRHRHRPLGPPAELPQPGPPPGLADRPDHRQPQPDRHPHRIHDLRHHRRHRTDHAARPALRTRAAPKSTRSTSRPNSAPASSTRTTKKSTTR